MPIARVLGILIVFGIVFMVFGGAVWHFTESWNAVILGEAVVALIIIPPVIIQARKTRHS
ncbi:MAG TPA: hypothetical protein ENG63_10880 [Candidatus Desulfofervidus auxilii]|uniref:Uncharacterized protein n=1 Tax=Desulfofervidus auxilii TaxID=1621989 RepID=A0A7C0U4D2_DESA2|nr:hypothetical protein [Candidatus Desulfofervidus auxilii]HDD45343.1 hypothetical protein [Candidatus Desulfofervidus auxilii]